MYFLGKYDIVVAIIIVLSWLVSMLCFDNVGYIHIKEHQRDVKLKHITQSALSGHNIETGHQILFDKTTIIAIIYTTSYFPRKYREAT